MESSQQNEKDVENTNDTEKQVFLELVNKYEGDYSKALFEYCFNHNIAYHSKIYKMLIKTSDESVLDNFLQVYIDTLQADPRYKDETFFSQIQQKNFEKIYSDEEYIKGLSEEDKKNRQVVLDVFSYDPFTGETESDKPQLYRDLAGMASEAMRKDVAKQKAAIAIVRSYGNIEKYQRKVAEITANGNINEDTQKQLDQYLTLISKIQTNINQTAEKNNFTVKGIGSNGKGMLSDVLNRIEEMGIDEGITNFYDIETSKSIEEVANISMKAQLNQVALTKTDYADILAAQCEMVKDAQLKTKQAMEALRLVKEKIKKQELLDELAADYKRKGISEKDIEEFIQSEFKMTDYID